MRPREVDKLKAYREAFMKIYMGFGKSGRDKLWAGYEVTDQLKRLAEYYDELFTNDILGKTNEQQPAE